MVGKQCMKLLEEIKTPDITFIEPGEYYLIIKQLEAFRHFHDVIQRYYDVSDITTRSENTLVQTCREVLNIEKKSGLFPFRNTEKTCDIYSGGSIDIYFGDNLHEYTIFWR